MSVTDIVRKAISLAWKNKVLWIFGVFAGCSYSNSSGSENGLDFVNSLFYNFGSAGLIVLSCIGLILLLISVFASYALARGTLRVLKEEEINFCILFADGKQFFGRGLVITMLRGLTSVGLVAAAFALYSLFSFQDIGALVFLIAVFVPVFLIGDIYFGVSSTTMVVENASL